MTSGRQIIIDEDKMAEFFKGFKPAQSGQHREYTDDEKQKIIYAYKHNLVKEDVARALRTSCKRMKVWYMEYVATTKQEVD